MNLWACLRGSQLWVMCHFRVLVSGLSRVLIVQTESGAAALAT